jgi:hypothetical protein
VSSFMDQFVNSIFQCNTLYKCLFAYLFSLEATVLAIHIYLDLKPNRRTCKIENEATYILISREGLAPLSCGSAIELGICWYSQLLQLQKYICLSGYRLPE